MAPMTLGKLLLRAAASPRLSPQQGRLLLAGAIADGWAVLDKAFSGVDLEFQPEAAHSEAPGTGCS